MTEVTTTPNSTSVPRLPASDENILMAAKGGGITFAGAMVSYAGRFILGILFARFMGADQYGLFDLIGTVLEITVSLSALGLSSALVHYVAVFAARRDTKSLQGTLLTGIGIPALVSLLTAGGLFACADPVARLVFHEPRLIPLLRLAALAIPFGVWGLAAESVTQGFKRMQYKVIADGVSHTLLKLALMVVFVAMGVGLSAFRVVAIHTVAIVSACVMMLYFLNRVFPLRRLLTGARSNVRQMLVFSLPVFFSQIVVLFRTHLQTIMLGMLNTMTAVGIFAVTSKVGLIGKMFHSSIVAISMPIVAELHSKGDREQLGRFYQTTTNWTFAFNLPMFLIVIMFSQPIMSIFGEGFAAGSTALIILSLGNLADVGTGINGVIVTMTGNTWLNTLNSIIVLLLLLALNLWLIPTLGAVGAAIASGVAIAVLNLARLLEVFILFRLWPYNKNFIKPILAGAIATAVVYVTHRFALTGTSLIVVALNMGLLLAVYVAVTLLLGLSEEDRTVLAHLYGRLRSMWPR